MRVCPDRLQHAASVILGATGLFSVVGLLVWDVRPGLFPEGAHDLLGAIPLALIAVAYLAYRNVRRLGLGELTKAVLLAIAFLFWAANQFLPQWSQATLFNDIAIALFVLDVFLLIVGWPTRSSAASFADTCVSPNTLEKTAAGPEDQVVSKRASRPRSSD